MALVSTCPDYSVAFHRCFHQTYFMWHFKEFPFVHLRLGGKVSELSLCVIGIGYIWDVRIALIDIGFLEEWFFSCGVRYKQ